MRHVDAGYDEALDAAARARPRPAERLATREYARAAWAGCSSATSPARHAGGARTRRCAAARLGDDRRRSRTRTSSATDGRIAAVGTDARPAARSTATSTSSTGAGCCAIPGLVDCHTHPAFARRPRRGVRPPRRRRRLRGAARGRRRHPVDGPRDARRRRGRPRARRSTRHRGVDAARRARRRGRASRATGSTARPSSRRSRRSRGAGGVPTWLGAHAVPPEFDDADAYLDFALAEVLPEAAAARRGGRRLPRARRVRRRAGAPLPRGVPRRGARAPAPRRPVHGGRRDPARDRARRALRRPPRGDRRRRESRRSPRSDVVGVLLPASALFLGRADAAGAGARRRGRGGRARDRLQPGQRVLREPAARLLARRDAARARAGRGARGRARSTPRTSSAAPTGWAGSRPGYDADVVLLDAPDWRYLAYHLGGDLVRDGRLARRRSSGYASCRWPTKKQRRRRAKEQRHEWENVYVDAEGNEVEVDRDDHGAERPAGSAKSLAAKTDGRRARAARPAAVVAPRRSKRGPHLRAAHVRHRASCSRRTRPTLARAFTQTLFLLAGLPAVQLRHGPDDVPDVAEALARERVRHAAPRSALDLRRARRDRRRRGSGPRRATARAAGGSGRRRRCGPRAARRARTSRACPAPASTRSPPVSISTAPVDDDRPTRAPSPGGRRAPARGRAGSGPRAPPSRVQDDRDRACRSGASIAVRSQRSTRAAARAHREAAAIDSTPVPPAVDTLRARPDRDELLRRPRRQRGAPRRSSSTRAATPAELRLELARTGARCAAILVTHTPLGPHRRRRRPRRGHRRAGLHRRRRGGRARAAGRLLPARPDRASARTRPDVRSRRATRRSTLAGHRVRDDASSRATRPRTSPSTPTARSSPATSCSRARSGGPTSRAATGTTLLASIRPLVDRYPPETVVYPGHGPATTLGAELARNPFLAELRARA